jgi:two-component system osmolarity sensor histidine kinase EnvZ
MIRVFKPNTVTGRIAILIIFIVIANFALTWVFSNYYTKKIQMRQAMKTISSIVSHLNRNDSLEGIVELVEEYDMVQQSQAPEELYPVHFTLLNAMADRFNEQNIARIHFFNSFDVTAYVWLQYENKLENYETWIGIPRDAFAEPKAYLAFIQESIIVFLILLGSLLTARSIQQPIKDIVAATKKLGAGQIPQKVEEKGPEEIQQLCHAFNVMVDDFRMLQREREIMLAGISHDLRTPLTRLQLAIDLLSDIDPKLRDDMHTDIDQITSMQQQFIDYISAGSNEPFNPVNIVEMVLHTVRRYDNELKNPIKVNYTENDIEVDAQAISLKRVFSNVINNAIKYGEEPISCEIKKVDNNVQIIINDLGEGVSPNMIEDMFKPLVRGDKARRNVQGSGLGLAIVKRILVKHQGSIDARSTPGAGFSVIVTLPIIAHH